ncbi:MAG: hypothetical protein ABI584_09765 [Acidobacteriota bacterium]
MPVFVAVSRSADSAVFLEESGEALFVQKGFEPPRAMLRLTLPPAPSRRPIAIASWRSEWLAVNGSDKLLRFSSEGRFRGERTLPGATSGLMTAGAVLWIHNGLGVRGFPELWSSCDGVRFDAAPDSGRPVAKGTISAIVEGQALLAGRPDGGLLVAYVIGPPTLYRLSVDRRVEAWGLAYWRSRERAALETFRNDRQELTDYSAPVRDLVANPDGTVLVLRNREDRRGAQKQLESEVGRRVDQYASDGAHTGTATFGETIQWVLRSRGKEIVVLTREGHVLHAPLGPPTAGGLVD